MRLALCLVLFALLPSTALAADAAWEIDRAHSRVGFIARHLGLAKVRGAFGAYSAKVLADPATGRLASIDATVESRSVDSGIVKRDDHLRSKDFFDAARFPTLRFVSKKVERKDGRLVVEGTLTIRDVSRAVVFTGEESALQRVDFGGGPQSRVAVNLGTKIHRKEFGLLFDGLAEGVSIVADDVEIELEVELYRAISG